VAGGDGSLKQHSDSRPGDIERLRARAGRALGHAWKLTEQSVGAFLGDRCPQLAAAISYFALLSIFPAAIVMTAIFGLVISDDEARTKVVDFLFNNLPLSEEEGRGDLESIVNGVTRNSETIGLLGLVGLMWAASALMGAVRNALAVVWGSGRDRPPLRGKALDLMLFLGLGLLIGLSVLLTVLRAVAVDLGRNLGLPGRALEAALDASGFLIPFALGLIAFAVVFVVVPYPRQRLRDVWPGVVLAAVGYELAKRGFALYLGNFGNFAAIYGSLGGVIVFLVFIYSAAMVLLLGGEFAALWPRVRAGEFDGGDGDGKPFREGVRGVLRGLVSKRDARAAEPRGNRTKWVTINHPADPHATPMRHGWIPHFRYEHRRGPLRGAD
jgi:membrane protein